jgi:hypothetical protein
MYFDGGSIAGSAGEALDRVEDYNESLSRAVSALEDAVEKLEQGIVYHTGAFERATSSVSLRSVSFRSVDSREQTERGFSMAGNHSEDELTDDKGPAKRAIAEAITSSDSDDDDTEFYTAPSHPCLETSRTPSPTAYQVTALRNSILQASQAPSFVSPRAPNPERQTPRKSSPSLPAQQTLP